MKQKPIEDRFHNARNDPSLVVIEGFHPLKHAVRFGAELLEVVSRNLEELAALQAEYAPDIANAIDGRVAAIPDEVFARLGPVTPPTGVMAIARRPNVDLTKLLADLNPVPVILLENPRNLFNIGAAVRAAPKLRTTLTPSRSPFCGFGHHFRYLWIDHTPVREARDGAAISRAGETV